MDEKKKRETNDFILIEAEKLSLDDEFMKFEPVTVEEHATKELISKAIKLKVKNFYRPKCDPSFTYDCRTVCFVPGKMPVRYESFNEWHELAKKYMPERNSRLGTRFEYVAFLGVLIKKLIEEGKSVEWAWNAVCNDSRELGHYWNSKNANHDDFEPTCSRRVCGFYDLANTYKMLAEDKFVDEFIGGFWLAGGFFRRDAEEYPIAKLNHSYERDFKWYEGVGWIVLD